MQQEPFIRMRSVFRGRVQGVGFRWTVCHLTEGRSITGRVRNLANGDVELIAEGTHAELVRLLEAIRSAPIGRHVFDAKTNWSEATGQFNRFEIAR